MLGNAVSSALDRFYAATPVEDRMPVQRIAAVTRVRPAEDGSDGRPAAQRDAREQATQRQALTQGVRAVFESSASGDASTNVADRNTRPEAAVADPKPDPLLEEAILRFIHTVFRSLAQVDGGDQPVANTGTADAAVIPLNGATASRSALGARIGALAQRYAEADLGGGEATKLTTSTQSVPDIRNAAGATVPDTALGQAFDDVMQVMRGNTGAAEPVQNSRADLVNLMQRLAQAMQGSPPVDPGLPTRGGLLSTRA